MRTQSLIAHEPWSVVVELRFSRVIKLQGSTGTRVHHIDADGFRWDTGQGQGAQLVLLRRGERVVSFSAHWLTSARLLAVPPPGSRNNAHWLAAEDQRLRDENERGTSTDGIARILGRSEQAVLKRLAALKLRAPSRSPVPRPRAATDGRTRTV